MMCSSIDHAGSFQPTFTHQIFGRGEDIVGHVRPKVTLTYTNPTLYLHETISADKSLSTYHDDIDGRLRLLAPQEVKGEGVSASRGQDPIKLEKERKEALEEFLPPGEKVRTYERKGRSYEIWNWRFDTERGKILMARMETLAYWLIDGGRFLLSGLPLLSSSLLLCPGLSQLLPPSIWRTTGGRSSSSMRS